MACSFRGKSGCKARNGGQRARAQESVAATPVAAPRSGESPLAPIEEHRLSIVRPRYTRETSNVAAQTIVMGEYLLPILLLRTVLTTWSLRGSQTSRVKDNYVRDDDALAGKSCLLIASEGGTMGMSVSR